VKKENDKKMDALMERLIKIEENNKRLEESDKKNKEEIAKLKEENTNYKSIIHNTQNNIGTQNNIIFKIKAYGIEDTSKITVNDYKRILGRGMNSVPAFVEKLHFDKNVPENHNVYISNLRDEYVLMYDGKKWRLKDRDEALQQLSEDKSDILETKFEELMERLDEPTIRMFERFLKIKDDDEEKIKIIKKELKKTLYENREIAMKSRRDVNSLSTE
jgi:predicted nuclease with TOPRIM domain